MNQKTIAEVEITVSGGRITCEQVIPDGKYKLVVEQENVFVKVQASKLRIDDEFMKYEPVTEAEIFFKELVEKAIESGLKDFFVPKYAPCDSKDSRNICYLPGNKPAVDKKYDWWEKIAKEFNPKRKSRLGTKTEYIAFLAILIKELVACGKSIEWAWDAICNNSRDLGHYSNSEKAKCTYEETGSRRVCDFYDLANTFKILAEDKEASCIWIAGGHYNMYGDTHPLTNFFSVPNNGIFHNIILDGSTAWIVLETD